MNNQTFIDTNILLYSVDPSDPKKRNKARLALKKLLDAGDGVISAQVAQEFFVIATKKLKITAQSARQILERLEIFRFASIDMTVIQEAVDCSVMSQISFWDALIVTTARSVGCKQVLTEDLNHLQLIRGVRIVNPFV